MAKVTGLSGNEIFCMMLKNYGAGELVVGNSVNSMGFLGGLASVIGDMIGGEVTQVTQVIEQGRLNAFDRMMNEAQREGAVGVTGVTSELKNFQGNTEFLFVGSCLHQTNAAAAGFMGAQPKLVFSSAGSAQELFCHMDAGYRPIQHVFGNIAYSIGIGGGLMASFKSLSRGEVTQYSDIFNKTRHTALQRIVNQARLCGANAVVGIRTDIATWHGTHEMLMTGTAAFNEKLPPECVETPITSDMTGEELWAMTSMGYAPVKLLISASIYSLGLIGGFKTAFQSLAKGEINDLTTLIHDARKISIDRLKNEADEMGAEGVVGIKTYIKELGGGLVEFLAIGTAIAKLQGVCVQTSSLPVQAIISDKNTWTDGSSGFSIAGGNSENMSDKLVSTGIGAAGAGILGLMGFTSE